ncbi:replicative DNA helicase [Saccharomonospora xinjiangensis]|uniref:Replicative DNA helicase n=1 Tax=Saccharomonospora xinjiangensis XJ-54 TaxID=882086 RepID=I0V2J6_9PSEU|nr:replicative DNA helicase [Saccharomonospora xinjiangensis]EID54349.1 replicative DNA helicase [Saccharomonospora xinjiangensis XJ-54]
MAITDDRGPAFTAESGGFERQPPQDTAAEQSVLGGMLLSKDAIADVVEVLRPGDFYRPAHQAVYDCILDLYGRGEPADPITVSAELERRGELARVGGAPYLHTLIATVPTAANAGYYAKIVAEKAILRRLVEAGTRIVQYGYGADNSDGGDVNEVVDRAQSAIYEVTERRTSEDYVALEELLQPTMDEIDAIASRGGTAQGIPTGFTDLDEVTNGLHPGQMIIIAARPGVGKSTLGLDFARSCSIKHGMTSVVFSLEMSRTEIVMRMLSAEAKIRLADMRGGRMSDDDWTRLARRMSEISEAPLFIDDSPNLTMMEIRAKARRLKQRNDLKLVVVDYMQLMTSGKRVESRQQEVSEFSRQLKLLAKELEVPVVAISQLNRGPEQRTDKRPMLADLRESGCLTAATRLLRADTGTEVSFGELLCTGERPIVWSLDERMRLVPRPITNVFSSGVKEVFKVRLASGREIEATGNHPMLTVDAWFPLRELPVGSRVAVPRRTPEPLTVEPLAAAEVSTLAARLGDSSRGHEKSVPGRVFSLPREQIALFLRHIWATDGSVRWDEKAGQARLYYATTSRRLADDIARLLARIDVFARIEPTTRSLDRGCYHVVVHGAENQLAFLEEAGRHGARSLQAEVVENKLREITGNTDIDTVPNEVWSRVRELLSVRSMTHRDADEPGDTRFRGSTTRESAPSRTRLAQAAAVLNDADLDMLATNDVFWDEIVEITSLGQQPVYDATVHQTHNFVANGVVLHNSLEQDADMVMLIHRPDAWERDDPRAGEADLILAKHRAGPTSTISVAHQLHYSRFTDLATE